MNTEDLTSNPERSDDEISRTISEIKNHRLGLQKERERDADELISRSIHQALWNTARITKEYLRPVIRNILSPLLPHSRFLQKKFQRPKSHHIDYKKQSNRSRPLIMHFLANFEIGGTPQLVCDIIEYSQDEYRHIVISKHIPKPAPYQGIDIIDLPLPLSNGILEDIIDKYSPDLIHIHYWNGMIQDFIWYHSVFRSIQNLQIPIVENVNTSGEPYFNDSVAQYIFCSEWSRKISGAPWIREDVIYPGTRIDDFYRDNISEVPDNKIGMVYRLGGDKIGKNAIEIFIEIMKSIKESTCIIVGDGDLVDYFKARVLHENLESRIEFTGWISYDRLREIYRELSVFVAPVKDDTFGSVSVYAMCAGIPVVGFDVGGIPEIIGNEELLAPPGDVFQFSEIVINLLMDRDRRLSIGIENQQRARDMFSASAMTESFKNLYGDLIGSYRPR